MKIRGLVRAKAFLLVAARTGAQPGSVESINNLNTIHRGEANSHHAGRLWP